MRYKIINRVLDGQNTIGYLVICEDNTRKILRTDDTYKLAESGLIINAKRSSSGNGLAGVNQDLRKLETVQLSKLMEGKAKEASKSSNIEAKPSKPKKSKGYKFTDLEKLRDLAVKRVMASRNSQKSIMTPVLNEILKDFENISKDFENITVSSEYVNNEIESISIKLGDTELVIYGRQRNTDEIANAFREAWGDADRNYRGSAIEDTPLEYCVGHPDIEPFKLIFCMYLGRDEMLRQEFKVDGSEINESDYSYKIDYNILYNQYFLMLQHLYLLSFGGRLYVDIKMEYFRKLIESIGLEDDFDIEFDNDCEDSFKMFDIGYSKKDDMRISGYDIIGVTLTDKYNLYVVSDHGEYGLLLQIPGYKKLISLDTKDLTLSDIEYTIDKVNKSTSINGDKRRVIEWWELK